MKSAIEFFEVVIYSNDGIRTLSSSLTSKEGVKKLAEESSRTENVLGTMVSIVTIFGDCTLTRPLYYFLNGGEVSLSQFSSVVLKSLHFHIN